MKIGLILSHKGVNYGMLLQAYATQKYIESKGVETEIINVKEGNKISRITKKILRYFSPVALKAAFKKAKRRRVVNKDPIIKGAFAKRRTVGLDFVKNRLHDMKVFNSFNEATEYSKSNYSCVMIGSDQQWAPACFYSKLNTLMFVPVGVKRASYATSMGVSVIPATTHSILKRFISKMDYISVREETGKAIICNVTGREDVTVVPDPTFLLTREEWSRYIPDERIENDEYIFCYFLGDSEEPVKKVMDYARKTNKKAIFVRNIESYSSKKVNYEEATVLDAPTVEEFINYIRHASLVCTDSFHCTVFSIINNTQFATFYRTQSTNKDSRNSRIDDLLLRFECTGRICNNDATLLNVVSNEINFEKINQKISSTRAIGENFLKEIIYE